MVPKITTDNLEQSLAILDQLPLSVYVLDKNMTITYWNDQSVEISGYARDETLGFHCADDILRHASEDGVALCEGGCPARACLADGQGREAKVYLHHKQGHRILIDAKIIPVFSPDGQVEGVLHVSGLHTAMEEAVAEVQKLQHLTATDLLTELPNRKALSDATRGWLSELNRTGRQFAMLMIDVNDFKHVNDTYGHGIGDKVLQLVGKTLRNVCRSHDIVGRWGGDEFLGLITARNQWEATMAADRMRAIVSQAFLIVEETRLTTAISIGIAMATPEDTPETLLERADAAMYVDKGRIRAY
jgi:diguanylate cyclase (GGDEF)-like protein/PAS domain S-box-containing protein